MDALPALLLSISLSVCGRHSAPVQQAAAKPLDEKSFEKSFESIQKLGDAGKWSDEKKQLLRLLGEAGDQPFVRSRRTELVDELRRAAIRTAVPQPDPATLTDGRLLGWDRHSGDLSVTYPTGKWADFTEHGRFFVHPAVFEGPVTLKVDGDDFRWSGNDLLEFIVGVHGDEAVIIAVGGREDSGNGRYFPALCRLIQLVGGSRNELGSFARAPTVGNRFDLEIVIGTTEIAVNSGGSRLGQAKLPDHFRGQIGLSNKSLIKHLSLRGKASTAWLQGKLDAITHDAEQKFLARWKVEDELPAWLKGDSAPANESPKGDFTLPWPLTDAQAEQVEKLLAEIRGGHADKALARIALEGDSLPRDVREHCFFTALSRLGMLSLASEQLDEFCARNPDFAYGRYLHAQLQIERVALDDAARELAGLHGKFGDPGRLAVDLVRVDLLRSQPEEAQRVLREARAEGTQSPEFDDLDLMVVHLLRGPNFPKRFEQKSPHFTLTTDIDNDTARASLKLLEESYAICSKVFGEADAVARPFPVYLFSGQAGYVEYAGKASKLAHSTAGMYSRLFKHLLLWNQPERGETTETLRHEATHQYLDLLGYRVPVWFNEGLAVYVQLIASSSKADVKGGAVDRVLLAALDRHQAEFIHLKQFVSIGPDSFYDKAAVTYPEAWAFVHFLRHGTAPAGGASLADPAPQEVNARLMAALQQRVAPYEVVKRAFDGVDLARFEKRFLEHLEGLRAQVAGH